MITIDMIKSIEIIEKLKLTKKSEVSHPKTKKNSKGIKNGAPGASRPFTIKMRNYLLPP
jgi:aspartate carbamoyltransferase regulatory subunit